MKTQVKRRILTAESVTKGHPDKLADLIADSILDECLAKDPNSRVACEVMLSGKNVFVVGEITTLAHVQLENVVRQVIESVGYVTDNLEFKIAIHKQSEDISQAVSKAEQGAGDQGIVYGFATDETENYMPLTVNLAHQLTDELTKARESGTIEGLLPDGKSQVSIEYDDGKAARVVSVVVSTQHIEEKNIEQLRAEIKKMIIDKVFERMQEAENAVRGKNIQSENARINNQFSQLQFSGISIDENTEILVNPSGRFVLGGFEADSGLTGRKLMVDSYGGIAHHGGGAYSGKDASKVDRSGAYYARYVAKNIVAAGLAKTCEVAISYAIGKAQPTSIDINTFETGVVSDETIKNAVQKVFDFRPSKIIEKLKLKTPVFAQTATGGHFGKEALLWEETDRIEALKIAVQNV